MDLIFWNNPGKKLEKTVYNPILGTLGTLGKSFSDFSATVFFFEAETFCLKMSLIIVIVKALYIPKQQAEWPDFVQFWTQ